MKRPSIIAVVQARVSSSRLPGKVLKPLAGKPMIVRQLERIKASQHIDKIILATSEDPSDSELVEVCRQIDGVESFRGSLNDVLDRFYRAVQPHGPKYVVRLTGDCPLIDPEIVDHLISFFLSSGVDYASNTLRPTFPDGLDAEVFKFSILEEAWKNAKLPSHREHVTPYLYAPENGFKLACYEADSDFSHLRWTVDEQLDYQLVSEIFKSLYPQKPLFHFRDVLEFLETRPELSKLNLKFDRNEGLRKSENADQEFLKKGR